MNDEIKQNYLDPISEFMTGDEVRALVNSSLTNFTQVSRVQKGYLESGNYVKGSNGWKLFANGDLEANNGTFRGIITALSGTFGSWTISGNSFATANSNILIGTEAGKSLTTGTNNTCIGYQAGTLLESASYNLLFGYQAGKQASPLAFYNTALGYQAGFDTAGVQNLYVGFQSGYKCNGNYNVYLGSQAGSNDLNAYYNEGNYNIFIGLSAGTVNQTGDGNVFLGYQSGYVNITGDSNVFLGYSTGYGNTGGAANVFIGYQAGYTNSVGDSSVSIGYQAGYKNTASNIICIGYQAGYNSTGLYDTFVGKASGFANTDGYSNSFYGYESGMANTTADHNTFIGYRSGYTNIIGNNNTFVGSEAGKLNTAGNNAFFGYAAGMVNSTATQNSFFGSQSGQATTNGGANSFFGWNAGYANIGGGSNCFYGSQAGNGNTDGNSNCFFGVQAGSVNTIGGQNILIGLYADCSVNHIDNSIGIGTTATVTDDNQCVIGGESDGKVTNFYLGSGVTNTSPVATTVQSTGGRGTNVAGAALNIGGGKSTGSADGGAINFQISLAGGAGSGLNGLTTKMIIDKNAQSVRTTDSPTFAGCTLTGTLATGSGTNDCDFELGANGTGNRNVYIDMHAEGTTYTDYALRIIRYAGANAAFEINQRGTGTFALQTQEAAYISFKTTSTERAFIHPDGGFSVYNCSPTQIADTVQFYSTDDAAGHTIPSFYCEGTNVVATGQADSASSVRVKMRINGTVRTFLCI